MNECRSEFLFWLNYCFWSIWSILAEFWKIMKIRLWPIEVHRSYARQWGPHGVRCDIFIHSDRVTWWDKYHTKSDSRTLSRGSSESQRRALLVLQWVDNCLRHRPNSTRWVLDRERNTDTRNREGVETPTAFAFLNDRIFLLYEFQNSSLFLSEPTEHHHQRTRHNAPTATTLNPWSSETKSTTRKLDTNTGVICWCLSSLFRRLIILMFFPCWSSLSLFF